MPHSVRPVDLEVDYQLFIDLLSRNLGPSAAEVQRFDWLYRGNPCGPARAWIAIEEGSGRGMGAAAAFPRKLCIGRSIYPGYVLGDFCIDHQYRSLGLALQLQRACLEQFGSPCSFPSYDFPSDQMMAVYRRMQIAPAGHMVRWSKPLRVERKMGELVKPPALAKVLAAPINKLLAWRDIATASDGGWMIAQHRGECGEEFTVLAHIVGSRYGACVERSADYLNWRYLKHPRARYEILTARWGEELKGYVVFSHTETDGQIVDLFGFSNTAMWTALVTHVVALLRERAIITVSVPSLATSPWTGLLKGWGFHPREASPVVVYPPGGVAASAANVSGWFLMDGDRES
jgi:hypothetical protein